MIFLLNLPKKGNREKDEGACKCRKKMSWPRKLLPWAGMAGIICWMILTGSCSPKITQYGKASYYSNYFRGRPTASGQHFHQWKRTAAHRTLPLGTKVKVVNLDNGRTVKVHINDRGPYVSGRIIDLSRKAARKLGMLKAGVANVELIYKKPR